MTEQPKASNQRQVARGILWLVAALLATYVAVSLPLPYTVAAPVFALVAVFTAIRLFRLASKGEHTMLVWLAGTAGLLGALLFGGIATSQIVLWEPTSAYEQCLDQALTQSSRAICETEYSEALWE